MCGSELHHLPEGVQRVAAFLQQAGHGEGPRMLDGAARTNIKVFDQAAGVVTELNESGREIDAEALKQMTGLVCAHAENSDYLILSGSMPPGCPDDYYATLIDAVAGLGCRCVLDADGERLRKGLEAEPFMIKPNRSRMVGMRTGIATMEKSVQIP